MSGPLAVVAAAAGCVTLAGCGGSSSQSSTTRSATTSSSTSSAAAPAHRRVRSARRVSGPSVGARQTVATHGADLVVTVERVLALSGTGSPRAPGTRQVGVQLRIANDAGQTYDSTSSGDVSLVISGGGQVLPLLVRRGPCTTPLVDFESMIVSGDVRSGCVGFAVPIRARVIGVRFSPHARPAGTLTWRVG